MIDIKKYANGKFYDTLNKKYISKATLKEMIKKGNDIKVTLIKTGEDITRSVIEKYDETMEKKGLEESLGTEKIKSWLGDQIDRRISRVLEMMKLPTREQVDELNKSLQAISKKIDALEKSAKKSSPQKKAPRKKTEKTEKEPTS